jgi:hypothetical protein
MTADIPGGGGGVWLDLAAELRQRLRECAPDARVEVTDDPSGLLQQRARGTCERCGDPVHTARGHDPLRRRTSGAAAWSGPPHRSPGDRLLY